MTSTYRKSEDYQSRLRKVVLHSGDVIPEDVARYVLEAVRHGHWQAQQDILKEYAPLLDWIPTTFVDACLEMLIRPEEQLREHDFHDWRDLGIRHDSEFLPSAHIQGPFLYALRRNPKQGLRLIHQLTNVAAERWCERERNPRFLDYVNTPLPISLEVGSRLREFWGTQDVYYWFRPNSNGPNAVVSALMALELWMEEEIKRGNPADELFAQVLSPSICVAVPGVCLGIALAYPEKCLRAALPITSCPAIWILDIARVAADRTPSYNFAFLGGDSPMYEARAERDRGPSEFETLGL